MYHGMSVLKMAMNPNKMLIWDDDRDQSWNIDLSLELRTRQDAAVIGESIQKHLEAKFDIQVTVGVPTEWSGRIEEMKR